MCPACGSPMVAFELNGVEIDRCLQCGGTWLDTGELEQIAELADAEAGRLSQALTRAAETGRDKPKRPCPRCDKKLHAVAVGPRNPIEIDRCPAGHGLWFDKGEMRTLIDRFAQAGDPEAQAAARFFADLFRHELQQSEASQPRPNPE